MTIVVDASVALKWFLKEQETEAAENLAAAGRVLIAPQLIYAEVGNGLRRATRLGRMPAVASAEAVRDLGTYLDRVHDLPALTPRAFALAHSLDHSIYDCYYLALAEAQETFVVTADRRLIERLRAAGLETRVRSLFDA